MKGKMTLMKQSVNEAF